LASLHRLDPVQDNAIALVILLLFSEYVSLIVQ